MFAENLTQTLRILTMAFLSLLLASCGSGSGQDSVDAADGDSAAARYELAFADYFGDPPDADSRSAAKAIPKAALTAGNWVVDTGYGENGWGNDEWQRYDNSMDNLFTQNGNLVIRARCATAPACGKRDGTITSAKVTSKNRINVRYGIIKARIKMPAGIGMWPAFWTLGSDIDERPWPNAGELDIVEMHYYYSDTHTTHFSTHWAGPRYTDDNRPVCSSGVGAIDPAEEENCKTESKTFDDPLTDGFHVYEIEWNENNIVGKIDGITYFNQAIDPATMEEFLKDHYLILNVAVGGTLGGPNGPSMSAADWADSGNTDMLVDWVEVFERVPASKGTLIDESGSNLSYNRIINSAEIGGAFVESDLENRAVTPLVGNSSLRIKYSTSIAESGNGAPASFSGAIFDFNRIDLSDYSKLVFSLNTSEFRKFDSLGVEFQDSRYAPPTVTEGAVSVRTNSTRATLIEINGDWKTYEIPLKHYAGVNMGDVVSLGFFNPTDSNGALIGGKLYVDDIRFVRSKQCNAAPTVEFDSLNYNPLTNVAAVTVKDACAAGSLALVTVDNGTDEIMVGVALDAAGRGQGLFNLVGGASVCETSDSASIIQLSGTLMAEYKRAKSAKGGSARAFAMAGIDGSAPGTTIAGAKTYIYASDPGQSLGFIPDTDFFFSDFGSGSSFDGDTTTDTSFSPVFSVSDLAAQQAILALFDFTDGFTADAESINFKVKNLPGDSIEVKFGQDGGPETAFTVDLNSYSGSSALGDGWYEVSIPMSEFPNADVYDYIVFASNNSSGADFTYLITDIFLQEAAGSVPAECAGEGGPTTGGSVPEVSIYEADGSVADLSPNYDPFTSGTGIATVMDSSYTQALELTSANGYGVSLVQLGLYPLTFTGYDEFLFKVKGLTADNTIVVKVEATGGGVVNVDVTNPPANVTTEDLGDGWTQVIMNLSAFGDVSSSSQIVFQTLDNAYAVGEKILLTDIGFNNAGGGTATGGSVPDVSIYEADGSVADLSPNYDPFTSGTGIATVMDSSYTQALELTSANGYGVSLVQLGLYPLTFTGYDELLFKVKGLTADNTIVVKVEATGGGVVNVDVTNPPANVTTEDLGDGWTQVIMNLSAFGDVSSSSQIVFQTLDNAYAVGEKILLTDIGFNNAGGGTATGGSVPDVSIYEADGSVADLSPNYDPFTSGTGIATVMDSSYTQALELTSANGYGVSLVQLGLYPLTFTGYDELLFKVKGLTADNTIVVKVEATGGGVVNVDVTNPPANVTTEDLGDGWTQVIMNLSAFGDVSSSSQIVFQTLDNAYAVGEKILLTDIGFNNAGGGTATGGSVPDVSIYEADGSVADLSPNYDPFTSGTGIATVMDSSYTQALELTSANGYGVSLVQLGLYPLTFTGYDELLFKVKGLTADNTIVVKVEATGGGVVNVDVTNPPANVTTEDLGDGWTQVIMNLSAFGDVSSSSQIVFQTLDNAYAVGEKILLTDIGFNNAGGGSGSGEQLAVNGDLEAGNGDLSGWTLTPNAGSITSVNDQDSGSTWAVNVSSVPANGTALSLDGLGVGIVQPGDTLDVSFDMCAVTADGGEIAVAVLSEFGGGTGADRDEIFRSATPADVWTRYNFSTTAGANVDGGVSLQFDVVCGGASTCVADAYFDNVSITLGGGPVAGSATGSSCAAPVAPGVTLPIDFEDAPYVFADFGGGQASIEANSQSGGINVSANVGKMLKFAGADFGGSTFDLGGTLTVPANSTFTMNVWSSRAVPVLFKLEGGLVGEVTATHNGGSVWEELTFDFTGIVGDGGITGITFIFDNGVVGDAATDPGNWTFYFDDIDFAPAPPAPNVTLFADALAPGWVGFLDANGTVTQVTDSNATYGEVLELTTGGSTVVGITTRTLDGGDGSTIDTSRFAVLEFDLKLVTAPTSNPTLWEAKLENPSGTVAIDTPVLDTWVHYSIPIGSFGTPNALDLLMLFPEYGANAGAVYRVDNIELLEEASPPPPEDITLFADALAAGWVGFLDSNGTVTQVTDSDSTYGEVLELTTGGSTVVGITTRTLDGGDGSTIDTNGYAVLEFDLKLVTAPTSNPTLWEAKLENPSGTVAIDTPVLDTWVHYSIPIGSFGTPNALDLLMLFPEYGANAGAVYRLDNVMLLVDDGGGGPAMGIVNTNGGFESGDFTGVETFPSAGTVTISSVNPRSGTFSAELDVPDPNGDALIKFANLSPGGFTAGQTIHIKFYMRGTLTPGGVGFAEFFSELSGGGVSKAEILFGNAPVFPNADASVWTLFETTATTGTDSSGGVTLQLKAASGGGSANLFFDDVCVSTEPCP